MLLCGCQPGALSSDPLLCAGFFRRVDRLWYIDKQKSLTCLLPEEYIILIVTQGLTG